MLPNCKAATYESEESCPFRRPLVDLQLLVGKCIYRFYRSRPSVLEPRTKLDFYALPVILFAAITVIAVDQMMAPIATITRSLSN